MVAIYAAAREQRFFSAVRQRAGRLLGGAVLSVLATATIAAAPAAAEPIGSVTINGAPARQCGTHPVPPAAPAQEPESHDYCVGSAPLITIVPPYQDSQVGPFADQRHMGFKNDEPPDGSDEITAIHATITPGVGAPTFAGAIADGHPFGREPCDPDSGPMINCVTYPIDAANSLGLAYRLNSSQSDYHGGLQSVNVEFNYGGAISACAGPAAPGGSASDARAADNCTAPSHTKITQAKINRNTAFFRFTARHATSFECELLRNKQVMFRHSCNSPKPYANPLPRGHYVFVLTGINRAGLDRKPATKKFTVN